MAESSCLFVYLPGAGGGETQLSALREALGAAFRFELIDYPGWRIYLDDKFSAEALIAHLAAEISARVPQGPVLIAGASLGGHFAYAVALYLKGMGREIRGSCVIDSFMIDSSGPSEGWRSRALAEGIEHLRNGRLGKFMRFARSRFWRALFRLASGNLKTLLRRSSASGRLPMLLAIDPIAEEELSLRLLIRAVAPWVASLDREPAALHAPTILLRTSATASDDAAWVSRCPEIKIYEIRGQHRTLFEPQNVGSLRDAFVLGTSDWCKTGR